MKLIINIFIKKNIKNNILKKDKKIYLIFYIQDKIAIN